jgi:hypothetical protein
MHDHVSPKRMEDFCARTLNKEEFSEIASQIAQCEICLRAFREAFGNKREHTPVSIDLSPENWFGKDHLETPQLKMYIEGNLSGIEGELADVHLEICGGCRERLQRLSEDHASAGIDDRAGAI